MNIFLHRDDLRVHDNIGLVRSSQDSETLPVYVFDPRVENRMGENKSVFRRESLKQLKEEYRDKNSDLVIRKGLTEKVVSNLSEDYAVEKVFFNRSYTPLKRNIEDNIHELDIETKDFKDRLLVEPKELDKEYGTFSHFYQEWKEFNKTKPFSQPDNLVNLEDKWEFDQKNTSVDIPAPGETAGLESWKNFRDNRLKHYKDRRDDVAAPEYVSRLSPHYSSGTLGLRKVLSDVENLIDSAEDSDKIRNFAKYRNELAWREFFYQILYHNPSTTSQNYRDFKNKIEWRNSKEEFEAWKRGETGIPFVDAGMRELNKTGYMHNRTRQNVASFLTKHLMVDWRKGAEYFRQKLVDHDKASNIGGWQWAASTGTDSVSIRIFNPVKQGRKYDPEAEYIKEWIPELRDLDSEIIHNWAESRNRKLGMNTSYPDPIIDYNQRYREGKKMFENALGK